MGSSNASRLKMKIIENLIPKAYQDRIEQAYSNDEFPWYMMNKVANIDEKFIFKNPLITNPTAFAHAVFSENQQKSSIFHIVYPILHFLEKEESFEVKQLIRIRSRLTTPFIGHTENHFNPPHVDLFTKDKFKTLVYYINDSDGDTILFNEQFEFHENAPIVKDENITVALRVPPIKGNAVLFDGNQFHSGNCPIKSKYRMVLNFDFFIKD